MCFVKLERVEALHGGKQDVDDRRVDEEHLHAECHSDSVAKT